MVFNGIYFVQVMHRNAQSTIAKICTIAQKVSWETYQRLDSCDLLDIMLYILYENNLFLFAKINKDLYFVFEMLYGRRCGHQTDDKPL